MSFVVEKSNWLNNYKYNVYSQMGDDGVIDKILQILPLNDKWCVEFGAWDGVHLTNTKNLIENKGYQAVLIECDPKKSKVLENHYKDNEKIITYNKLVGFNDHDGLDTILRKTIIPENFDLLSIDIDGNDYHVWKSFSHYNPKVVIIEFNPTIPKNVHFVQEACPKVNQGCSLASLIELGKSKDYELICVLSLNAYFVRKNYFPLFNIENNSEDTLRSDEGVTHFFMGYDGKIILKGNCVMPWHGLIIKESKLQVLPKYLQKFPPNYTFIEKILFAAFFFINNPRKFLYKLRSKWAKKN